MEDVGGMVSTESCPLLARVSFSFSPVSKFKHTTRQFCCWSSLSQNQTKAAEPDLLEEQTPGVTSEQLGLEHSVTSRHEATT